MQPSEQCTLRRACHSTEIRANSREPGASTLWLSIPRDVDLLDEPIAAPRPSSVSNETELKAILLPGADFTQTSVDSLYAHVLILEQHHQHYERVGIAQLPAAFGNVDYPSWFFALKNKFGNLYYRIYDPDMSLYE
jgi:hypothetical protein